MTTAITTLRSAARGAALAEVQNAEQKSHELNYETIYVGTDGDVYWHESINKSDREYYRNRPGMVYVEQLLQVGCGSASCNCDCCLEIGKVLSRTGKVVDADNPEAEGGDVITQDDAIRTAISNADVSVYEDLIEARLADKGHDAIPYGYFDDEQDEDNE